MATIKLGTPLPDPDAERKGHPHDNFFGCDCISNGNLTANDKVVLLTNDPCMDIEKSMMTHQLRSKNSIFDHRGSTTSSITRDYELAHPPKKSSADSSISSATNTFTDSYEYADDEDGEWDCENGIYCCGCRGRKIILIFAIILTLIFAILGLGIAIAITNKNETKSTANLANGNSDSEENFQEENVVTDVPNQELHAGDMDSNGEGTIFPRPEEDISEEVTSNEDENDESSSSPPIESDFEITATPSADNEVIQGSIPPPDEEQLDEDNPESEFDTASPTDFTNEVTSTPTSTENTNNQDVTLPPDIIYSDEDLDFGYDYTANTDYLVGVYYYPWHGNNFHNGEGYLRKELIPPHQPALGEYDDSRPDVIAQHMRWFQKANIGLLVTSWWGPNRLEDTNTRDVIMNHEDIGNLKIVLHYETSGRITDNDMSVARSDIQYMCETYFDHPNYYKVNDRPVLVIYITRSLHADGILEEALLTMRSEAAKCGHNLYLIGDQVFASAPNPDEPFVPFW